MLILDRQFGRTTEIYDAVLYNCYAKVMQHVHDWLYKDVELSNFILRVPKF